MRSQNKIIFIKKLSTKTKLKTLSTKKFFISVLISFYDFTSFIPVFQSNKYSITKVHTESTEGAYGVYMSFKIIIYVLIFRWSFNLFRKGYKKGITLENLWQAREGDHSGPLGDRLEEAWNKELEFAKRNGSRPSFSKALIRSFWVEYMMCGVFVGLLFVLLW